MGERSEYGKEQDAIYIGIGYLDIADGGGELVCESDADMVAHQQVNTLRIRRPGR